MKNNLLKKFLSFSYGSWVGLIIGFLGTMISTRILSPEDFGKASMFTLALNIFMIFIIFGTDQSFVRFFYEEKEENRGGLLFNSIKVPIFISLITIIIIMIFNKSITIFLFGEENLVIAIVLVIGIIAQVLYRFGVLVIRMQQKGNLFSLFEILNKSLNLGLLITLYFIIGKSYEIIIFATVSTILILSIISILLERKYWNIKNYSKSNLKHSINDIFLYGSPLVLTTLITWLFQSFDRIAIKEWSSFEELGLYAAAFKIVALLSILRVTFSTFWAPVCYEHYEKEPENTEFFSKTAKYIAIVMFFVATATIAGKEIITLLLGKEFREASSIMPFLVFMPIMYTLSEATVIGINLLKKPKWHILIAGISCIANIIGNWILVPRYGAIGAAISTAFSYVIFFSLRTLISLRYYKVNYNLKKIYLMISIISVYAIYSINNHNILVNILMGLGVLLILTIVYLNDIREIINILVSMLSNRKISKIKS